MPLRFPSWLKDRHFVEGGVMGAAVAVVRGVVYGGGLGETAAIAVIIALFGGVVYAYALREGRLPPQRLRWRGKQLGLRWYALWFAITAPLIGVVAALVLGESIPLFLAIGIGIGAGQVAMSYVTHKFGRVPW